MQINVNTPILKAGFLDLLSLKMLFMLFLLLNMLYLCQV